MVRDQIIGIREVGEPGEHLVPHRLGRLVVLVLDDLGHVLEGDDRLGNEGGNALRRAHVLHELARVLDDGVGVHFRGALLRLAIQAAEVGGVLLIELEGDLELRGHGSCSPTRSNQERDPRLVGAVAPSSRFLARKMLEGLDLKSGMRIVEFGPGTGSFTGELFHRLAGVGPGLASLRHVGARRLPLL